MTPTPAANPSPSPGPEQAQAQRLVDRLLHPSFGQANAAAYTTTTFAKYLKTLPDAAGLPSAPATSDEVIVVEVDGQFQPPVSCYAPPCPTVTSIIEAYDMTLGLDLGIQFGSGSLKPPNLGAVRALGTPIPLSIGG